MWIANTIDAHRREQHHHQDFKKLLLDCVIFQSVTIQSFAKLQKKSAHAHHFRILHIFYEFYAMVAKCSSSINISRFQIKIIFDNIYIYMQPQIQSIQFSLCIQSQDFKSSK